MSAIRLGHVRLITADLDRFARFYEHTIGLRLVAVDHAPQHAARRLGVFTDPDGIAIIALERPELDLDADPLADRSGLDQLAYDADADDFETALARLVETGASDGAVESDGPARTVSFVDPDGRTCLLCRHVPDWTPPDSVDVLACPTLAGRDRS